MTLRNALMASALLAASATASASLIDNTGAWDGNSALTPFGWTHTATYGQVVKATGSQLDAFSFLVNLPDDLQFKAYAYAWDGAKASGPALYTSGVTTDGASGYNTVAFNTGGVAVNNGQDYILFLSISELYAENDGVDDIGRFAWVDTDSYTDGDFYWFNNDDNFAALTTQNWEKWLDGDFAFTASFSNGNNGGNVPEPNLLALLGLGVLGLAMTKRRQAD